ncbi:putative diphthamide synthesis protein [Trypanosoma grayi]|uniref:putative diphthamide synthesis protein n=1 Tax=Trypanosoma grayi TaxID=71804 RepID=UPI0004F481DD|nr:putative diphthamide synthesis protein [Trypanosoma grayi]KEG14130.1 putative diphthamide synthesis protein [Trypanosoma grayi]
MFHDSPIAPAVTVQRRHNAGRSVRRHYKLDDVAAFIMRGAAASSSTTSETAPFRRVALQFPDDLLEDAVAVTQALKQILTADARCINAVADAKSREGGEQAVVKEGDTSIHLFVVADNTFGSCCPDEITAQHYHGDCIIHFGDACMSRSTRIPVFYVQDDFHFAAFVGHSDEQALSVHAVVRAVTILQERLKGLHSSLEGKHVGARIVLVVVGSHRSRSLIIAAAQRWRDEKDTAAGVNGPDEVAVEWCGFESLTTTGMAQQATPSPNTDSSWVINGANFSCADHTTLQHFLFVGPSNASLPLHLLNVHQYNLFHRPEALREAVCDTDGPAALTILDESFGRSSEARLTTQASALGNNAATDAALEAYFSHSTSGFAVVQVALNKRARQRAYNVELIRSSAAVGIVVASLAIEGYYETTMLLHKLLRAYGKRAYIIYIGHLNQYKIANFVDTVDCFVAIACPNSREGYFPGKDDGFSKPIVSPVEVLLALRTEDGDSPLYGHRAVYSTTFDCVLPPLREAMQAIESDRAKEKTATVALPQEGGSGAALIRASAGTLTTQGANGALIRLHERTFVGLDPKTGQTPVQAEILQGHHGIARGYATEREQQQQKPEE